MRAQSAAWTDRWIRPAVHERNITVGQFVPFDVCHAFLARGSTSRRHCHHFAHIRVEYRAPARLTVICWPCWDFTCKMRYLVSAMCLLFLTKASNARDSDITRKAHVASRDVFIFIHLFKKKAKIRDFIKIRLEITFPTEINTYLKNGNYL